MFSSVIDKIKTLITPKYNFYKFEIHITDHCNIDCMGCAHYSTLAPKFFLDIETFENDVTELTKKFNYKMMNILGGEPLLHPEIEKFFYSARRICPNMQINLFTNGILLPTKKDKFWDALRENDIQLVISRYPVNKDKIDKYLNLIKEKKCKLYFIYDGMTFYLRKKRIADSDKNVTFEYCDAKISHQLYKGMLYPCQPIAYGRFYNAYFNQDFFKGKGIDIYKSSAKQIYKFLTNPHDDCAGCALQGRKFAWKRTQYKQEEWDSW